MTDISRIAQSLMKDGLLSEAKSIFELLTELEREDIASYNVVLRPRGIPIGNLTSQFFANVLLDQLDHHVKETMCAPGYVRYADDMIFVLRQQGRALATSKFDRSVSPRLKIDDSSTQNFCPTM